MLVHTLSNAILTPLFDHGAKQANSCKVVLDSSPVDVSHCKMLILPDNNLSRLGESVMLSEPLHFSFKNSKVRYNLNIDDSHQDTLIATLSNFAWNVGEFDRYEKDDHMRVKYGTLVSISNRELGMWLTASPCCDTTYEFFPDLKQQEEELQDQSHFDLPSVFSRLFKAKLTYESRDYNIFWMFEREDRFKGGTVLKGDKFLLKHAASEKYLNVNGDLIPKPLDPSADFLFTVPTLENEGADLDVMFNELLEIATDSKKALVPAKEKSKRYIWSALFSKQLELHERYRDQIYQPVAFQSEAVERHEARFEVEQPDKIVVDTFNMFLCLRPQLSTIRLFYRRLEALVSRQLASKGKKAKLISNTVIKNAKVLAQFLIKSLGSLDNDSHMKIMQESLFALGYHLEMMETVYLHHKKMENSKCEEQINRFPALEEINTLFESEALKLILEGNQFACMRLLEDEHLVPKLKETDPAELSEYLKVAFEVEKPGLQEFYSYLLLFQKQFTCKQSLENDCDLIDTFASLCHKLEGSVLDVAPMELLSIVSFTEDVPGLKMVGYPQLTFEKSQDKMHAIQVHAVSLINSVCKICPGKHTELAARLNLDSNLLRKCIDLSRYDRLLQLKLQSISNYLFLSGTDRKKTVTEKMKLMCFQEEDSNYMEEDAWDPLKMTSRSKDLPEPSLRDDVISAINSEFYFWLGSHLDPVLEESRIQAIFHHAKNAKMALACIKYHIEKVSILIDWRYVNDTFVCCIEQAVLALLDAFNTNSESHESDYIKSKVVEVLMHAGKAETQPAPKATQHEHWSSTVMRFVLSKPQDAKATSKRQTQVKRKMEEGTGETEEEDSFSSDSSAEDMEEKEMEEMEVEVTFAIDETFHSLLKLYELILYWYQLRNTRAALKTMAQSLNWRNLDTENSLSSPNAAKLKELLAQLVNPSHKDIQFASFMKSITPLQDDSGTSALDPLLTTTDSSHLTKSLFLPVLQKNWERSKPAPNTQNQGAEIHQSMKTWPLKDLLLKLLVESNEMYSKHSKLLIKLLSEVTNPTDTFLKHMEKGAFVEDTSLDRIRAIMHGFGMCRLDLKGLILGKDSETRPGDGTKPLSWLEQLVAELQRLVTGLQDLSTMRSSLQASQSLYHKAQTVLSNFGILELLEELWDLNTLLDNNHHSDDQLAVHLKTLTIAATRFYCHKDKRVQDHVVNLMHEGNFFIDFPEYIEMLGDFQLLTHNSQHTISLLTEMLLDSMVESQLHSDRIMESVVQLMHEGGAVAVEAVTAVVAPVLKKVLHTEKPDLQLVSRLLQILSKAAQSSRSIRRNMRCMFSNGALIKVHLHESENVQVISSALNFLKITCFDEENKESIQGFSAEKWYRPISAILDTIDIDTLVTAMETGRIRVCDSQQYSDYLSSSEDLGSLQFLYHLNRFGEAQGLLVDYPILYGKSPSAALEDLFIRLYGKCFTLLSKIAKRGHLSQAVWKAFKAMDDHFTETYPGDKDVVRTSFKVPPQDDSLDPSSLPQGHFFDLSEALEKDLIDFLSVLHLHLTPETTGAVALFSEHFQEKTKVTKDKKVHQSIETFRNLSKRTKKIFIASRDPQTYLQIKSQVIKGWDLKLRMEFNESYWETHLVEQALDYAIRSHDIKIRLSAFVTLNSILDGQSEEFRELILNHLRKRQRYFVLFSSFRRGTERFLKMQRKEIESKSSDVHGKKREEEDFVLYLEEFLLFFQRCCDDCFTNFQNFLRIQTEEGSSSNFNLIAEISHFVVYLSELIPKNFSELSPAKGLSESVMKVARAALLALEEAITGPCNANQQILGKNPKLYTALNAFVALSQINVFKLQKCKSKSLRETFCQECQNYTHTCKLSVSLHSAVLSLLNALLEGHESETGYIKTHMVEKLKTNQMLQGLETMHQFLKTVERCLRLETGHYHKGNKPKLTLEQESAEMNKSFFDVGVQQMIVLLHIHKRTGLSLLQLRDEENGQVDEEVDAEAAIQTPLGQSVSFFLKYVGAVEIMWDGQIYDELFQIPMRTKFLTLETQMEIMDTIKRGSQQEKIDDFISKVEACEAEMKHQQFISRFPGLKIVSGHWNGFSDLSFGLIVIINLILLIGISSDGENRFSLETYVVIALGVCGQIQIGVMVVSRVLYWIEFWHTFFYPLTTDDEGIDTKELYAHAENTSQFVILGTEAREAKNENTIQRENQKKDDGEVEPDDEKNETCKRKLSLPTVSRLIGHVIYAMLCVLALLYWPEIYPILLLDAINHSEDLANILKAVTLNGWRLTLTAFFSVTIVYIFSVWSYFLFYGYYTPEGNMYCDNLLSCFFSTLNIGVRTGSIGEDPYESQDYYWRMLYDFLFFVIIIVILLNIVFGIIIDTFGQLRDEKNEVEDDIKNVCFICGQQRSLIDLHGEGWEKHITAVHSPFAYLALFIYLREKPENGCSGLEKYVKNQMEDKESDFIPNTSHVLVQKVRKLHHEGISSHHAETQTQ